MRYSDLAGRIETVERRMDSMDSRWEASIADLSTQILQSNRETREAVLATLRGEVAGEFATSRAETAAEFAKVRAEFAGDFSTFRAEIAEDFSTFRSEITAEFATARAETAAEFAKFGAYFETALADGLSENRRYMRVLYEDILSRITLLAESRPSPS
jgi:hypothetical protein